MIFYIYCGKYINYFSHFHSRRILRSKLNEKIQPLQNLSRTQSILVVNFGRSSTKSNKLLKLFFVILT